MFIIGGMIQNARFNHWLSAPLPTWTRRGDRALPKFSIATNTQHVQAARAELRLVSMFIARPIIALVAFVAAAAHGWWWLAAPTVGLVYGSALTCVHHLVHGSLGLSPRARRFWLRHIGLLVAESGHALQVTHLAHHRAGSDVPDPEGYIEYVTWRQLPLAALAFRYRLMFMGLKMAPASRRGRIGVELGVHAILHLGSLALLPVTIIPWAYLSLIHVSSFAFALLAGKGPQTNYGRPIDTPFVRVHTALGRLLFFSHDQHLEHHAAPKVPLPHLRRLKADVDGALDGIAVVDVRMPL